MNCRDARRLLPAYLEGEVTPSERIVLQAHLARCLTCREALGAQSALQSRLRHALHARVAHAAPSPQALSRLQASLAAQPGGGRRLSHLTGGWTMMTRTVVGLVATLALSVGTALAVPPVRAHVADLLKISWFSVPVAGVGADVAVGFSGSLAPLYPAYLPPGPEWRMGVRAEGDAEATTRIELKYARTGEFVSLVQTPLQAALDVSAGEAVGVNGAQGRLVTGLEGRFEADFPRMEVVSGEGFALGAEPAGQSQLDVIAYTDGKLLVWRAGDRQLQMLSNLPLEEMLKIAASLTAAAVVEGEVELVTPEVILPGAELEAGLEGAVEVETRTEGSRHDTAGAVESEAEVETGVDVQGLVDDLEAEVGAAVEAEASAEVQGAVGSLEATAEAATDLEVEGEVQLPELP